MHRSKRSLGTLFSAVVLLACSSSDPSNEVAPANVSAQSACEHEFRVRVERCDSALVASGTLESARKRYIEICVGALDLTGSTRTANEVEACAKAVEAEECGVIPDLLAACAPKPGTLPAGSACNVDAQCQGGHCDRLDLQARRKGCGVCLQPIREGASCDPEHTACALGTLCIGSGSSPPTCRRARYADENGQCGAADVFCRPGFMCASFNGGAPSCIRKHTVGEECPVDAACEEGTFCNETTQRCEPRGDIGMRCDPKSPCLEALGCLAKTCTPLVFTKPGASCGGNIACREGVCGQGTGAQTCPEIVEDGEACLEGAHMTCRSLATCVAGVCVTATTLTCQ